MALASEEAGTYIWSSPEERIDRMSATMLALVGAYFVENGGGFHSVAQLLAWMDKSISFEQYFTRVAPTLFGPLQLHKGRTDTFDYFWEEICGDGERVLHVG